MNHPAKILVIIPCYNEEANIVSTVERLRATCPQVDFLIINDCSTDRSAELLAEHGYPFLDLPVNLGIGGGVQCGYRYARANGYDVAVQMDGDGQHDPAYLMQVVQPVLDGKLDMCIGSRFIKCEGFQTSFMRRVGIRFLSWLIHILCGQRILDVTSGFRATGPQLTAYFAEHYASDYPEPEAILAATLAGLVRNRDRLMGIGQAITMPLFFASNALYPVDIMPGWLHALSTVNPLSYEVNALRSLLLGTPGNTLLDIAVLAVAAVLGIAAASSLLRRLVR